MSEETSADYDAAKGKFHHIRLAITNVVQVCTIENDRWWRDPRTNERVKRNVGELLMLMVSELAEAGEDSPQYLSILMEITKCLARAMEGHRKDKMDDKLPHRKMFEVELADCIIRICDTAGQMGLDLGGAVAEKLEYNSTRKDHTHEARLAPGGKKY